MLSFLNGRYLQEVSECKIQPLQERVQSARVSDLPHKGKHTSLHEISYPMVILFPYWEAYYSLEPKCMLRFRNTDFSCFTIQFVISNALLVSADQ